MSVVDTIKKSVLEKIAHIYLELQDEKSWRKTIEQIALSEEDDIKRQYKSKLYPFACDFYIKSLDLYIECNGHWSHGWYNNKCLGSFDKDNPEHIKILELYKNKNTKYYRNVIKVWTDLDVRKLETFKKNKLNYKIFWNLKEVEDWIRGI